MRDSSLKHIENGSDLIWQKHRKHIVIFIGYFFLLIALSVIFSAAASAMPPDPPPKDYDVPEDFKYDNEFVNKIATTLSVHRQYVIQGCFYYSLGAEGKPPENDEIMAWVLENHPRVCCPADYYYSQPRYQLLTKHQSFQSDINACHRTE